MRAGFEYYRAFPQDAKDNIELAATAKLTIPVLVLSGDIYPALGGDIPGSMTLNSIQSLALATNVQGVIVPYSGHWIPEERPDFLINFQNSLEIVILRVNRVPYNSIFL